MKKIFYIALITMSSQLSAQDSIPQVTKLKDVEIVNDYHENIKWIKSKPVPLVKKDFLSSAYDVTYMQIYFGMYVKPDGSQGITPIRLINRYKDNDWIFFDEVSYLFGSWKEVRSGKGKVFKIQTEKTDKEVTFGISEKSDVTDENTNSLIKYILEIETDLNIRYTSSSNNKYVEIDVAGGTKKLKKSFESLIDAYNLVNKNFKLNHEF